MTLNELITKMNSSTAPIWDVGSFINRTGAYPVDSTSVFVNKAAAEEYITTGPTCYPGQIIVYGNTDGSITAAIVTPSESSYVLNAIEPEPISEDFINSLFT